MALRLRYQSDAGGGYSKPFPNYGSANVKPTPRVSSQSSTLAFAPTYSGSGGMSAAQYKLPAQPKPEIPMLSLDEMMDIINRRVGLMIDPELEALRRGLEEARLSHQRQVGGVTSGYEEARQQLGKMGEQHQREGASTMRRRGIYDSGLAMDLANRLQRQTAQHGAKLETEQSRVLTDLAEALALHEKQTDKQVQALEGRRGDLAQSLLDEMQQQERARKDQLEQKAFENWMAQQSMQHQIWQANQQAAARAAASRASSAQQAPSYNNILDQFKIQALLSMPQEQQYQYALDPTLWRQSQLPQWDDFLGQQRVQGYGSLTDEERRQILFNELYPYGISNQSRW